MRLLNTKSMTLSPDHFYEPSVPNYVILSHTWEDGEVLCEDLVCPEEAAQKKGWRKIHSMCQQAQRDGYEYAWIDTCCIDKRSSAELSEAINSMFYWYKDAQECYAYLSDYSPGDHLDQDLGSCRWFTRGWTLQELIAPRRLIFFDREWNRLGSKDELCAAISQITAIPSDVLLHRRPLSDYSVAQRMSWAAPRSTTRIEDSAYCLMGIFDINMPLLYGERHKAFLRLQEEIIKQVFDLTLLAWTTPPRQVHDPMRRPPWSILAPEPWCFSGCGGFLTRKIHEVGYWSVTTNKLLIRVKVCGYSAPTFGSLYLIHLGVLERPHENVPMNYILLKLEMTGPSQFRRTGTPILVPQTHFRAVVKYEKMKATSDTFLCIGPAAKSRYRFHIEASRDVKVQEVLPRRLFNDTDNSVYDYDSKGAILILGSIKLRDCRVSFILAVLSYQEVDGSAYYNLHLADKAAKDNLYQRFWEASSIRRSDLIATGLLDLREERSQMFISYNGRRSILSAEVEGAKGDSPAKIMLVLEEESAPESPPTALMRADTA